ncbi:hypothetical protein PR048_025612 [Dryococelus australis]|uniref:Mutator-like transposase domain-containing protein n=1 Tax=Dryococelus australis TaxID=614101 RepID=A0ABQ9GRW8_9NEOP|nr:hypothetical protein PR048_025612 [Dryococelus australis]
MAEASEPWSGGGYEIEAHPSLSMSLVSSTQSCCVCNASHSSYKCPEINQLSPQDRYTISHQAKFCPSTLSYHICGSKHHTLLHFEPKSKNQGSGYDTVLPSGETASTLSAVMSTVFAAISAISLAGRCPGGGERWDLQPTGCFINDNTAIRINTGTIACSQRKLLKEHREMEWQVHSSLNVRTSRESTGINDAWVNSMLLTGRALRYYRQFGNAMKFLDKNASSRRRTIQAREVDADGIPVIAVVTDGAWSRRSHGTNYNVLSGVACIIDTKSKMILFASTRNSYCCICDRASSKGESTNSHVCCKKRNKLSTAMKADIIVEGFRNSIVMHHFKYNKLIEFYLAASAAVASPTAGVLDVETYKYYPRTTFHQNGQTCQECSGTTFSNQRLKMDVPEGNRTNTETFLARSINHPAQSHQSDGKFFYRYAGTLILIKIVLFSTAQVEVLNLTGCLHVGRVLLDTASQASFITEGCMQKLHLRCNNAHLPIH